jgi:hypothetical protein
MLGIEHLADPHIAREAVYVAMGGAPLLVRSSPGAPMPSPTSAMRGSGRRPPGSTCAS